MLRVMSSMRLDAKEVTYSAPCPHGIPDQPWLCSLTGIKSRSECLCTCPR